jgi:hypothetical protein
MERARGKHDGEVCLSTYSITENIKTLTAHNCPPLRYFCSLNVTVSHCILKWNYFDLSPHVLSPCSLPLPPTCLLATVNEARSYFAPTIRRGFDESLRLQLFRPHRLELGTVLNMFSNIKFWVITLLLEEEQFRRERISSERKMRVHKCFRNRKMEGEFCTLFKELTEDELKFYQYFRMSRYQFSDLLKTIHVDLLKKGSKALIL